MKDLKIHKQSTSKFFYLLLMVVVLAPACSPDLSKQAPNDLVTLVRGDTVYHVHVLPKEKQIIPRKEKMYHWYHGGHINVTQGYYKGKLLHGEFVIMHKDSKALIEKGMFEKGNKHGEWIQWNPHGIITSWYTWKDGVRNGTFKIYYPNSVVKMEGKYIKGQLHGKIYTYDQQGNASIKKYDKGQLIVSEDTSNKKETSTSPNKTKKKKKEKDKTKD